MNAYLDARVKMFHAVDTCYLENQGEFDVITAFPGVYSNFKAMLTDLGKLIQIALKDTKSTTATKNIAKKALKEAAMKVADSVAAYAASIENIILQDSMDITYSYLNKLTEDQLGPRCQTIFDEADAVKTQAAPFNLSEGDLTALENAIEDFGAKQATPQTEKGKINKAKKDALKKADEITLLLEQQMDKMVDTLAASNPLLVGIYKTARVINNPPTTHTQLKTFLLDSDTELPLPNINVLIYNGKNFSGTTNEEGMVHFKPLKNGLYNLTVNMPGYQPFFLQNVKVKLGQVNKVTVMLVPEAPNGNGG